MNFKFLLLILILFVGINFVSAQIRKPSDKPCFQPFALEVDKFNYQDKSELEKRLTLFQKKLDEYSNEAKGYVLIYGGNKVRVNEVPKTLASINSILNVPEKFSSKNKFQVWIGGYRLSPTVEFL